MKTRRVPSAAVPSPGHGGAPSRHVKHCPVMKLSALKLTKRTLLPITGAMTLIVVFVWLLATSASLPASTAQISE